MALRQNARESDRVHLYDTTLRDGAQTRGINFSLKDKLAIIAMLEELGIDYIEGGWPGANQIDTELFSAKRTTQSRFVAFGMTRRIGVSTSNDPGLRAVIDNPADAVCLVAKSDIRHVEVALRCSPEENLNSVRDSVHAVVNAGKEAMIDCEHFFDGCKRDLSYALACATTAAEAGARWIVLCDTVGGCTPGEISRYVDAATSRIPGNQLGIHCHNDMELAIANTLAALESGVRQVQGTLGGIGERCGNTNFFSLLPTLLLKKPWCDAFRTRISSADLTNITALAHRFDDLLNQHPNPSAAYVGSAAFAHKGGLHASAVRRDPTTYEHIDPTRVGNSRNILVSDQAGRSNLMSTLERFDLPKALPEAQLRSLLAALKEKEQLGFSYDSAEASLEIYLREHFDLLPTYFNVESYRVTAERRYNTAGKLVNVAEAVVKVRIEGKIFMSVAEGNGPVHALDAALRKNFGALTPRIENTALSDYRVRILNPTSGTRAVTRVLVEGRDQLDRRWWTVGVSPNIIDASFDALIDSLKFQLLSTEPLQRIQ